MRPRIVFPSCPEAGRGRRERLADGTEVGIRSLEPADREALTDLYGRLGQHSRYQRFFACPPRLPASWVDALLDLSPERRLGLVAEPVADPGRIVALADYTVCPEGARAEVGLVVEDSWQQRGLGRVLFERLLAVGESRGLRSFVAFVHCSNVRAIRGLASVATIVDRTADAGVVQFTFTKSRGAWPFEAPARKGAV